MAFNTTPGQMSYPARSQWSSSARPSISTIVPPNPYAPSSHPSHHHHLHHQQQRTIRGASEIIPGLFISDLSFAENAACLSSYGITHVMSVISGSVRLPSEQDLYPFPPPRHLHVRVEDMPFAELAQHLPITTAWIREAYRTTPRARILVHCGEGISRSVSVVAAFLIAQYQYSPSTAVEYIKSKRRVANPNPGFVQQLVEYARSLGYR